MADHLGGVLGILIQHGDDLIDGDRVMMRMPAIVVGDHGDGDVAELGFARELCLLQVGHADDVHAEAAVDVGLGLGRELGTFHAEVGAAEFAGNLSASARRVDHGCQFVADGVGKSNVGNHAAAEERVDTMASAIEELVGDDEVEGLVLFLQRTDRGDGNDALDAELLEAMNFGAEDEFAGEKAVASSVTRQKSDLAPFKLAADVGVGRRAERRFDADLLHSSQAGHGIESAAADDPDFCLWQSSPQSVKQLESNR